MELMQQTQQTRPASRTGTRLRAAGIALALLPAEAAFWIGFDLPAGPVRLARTALVLLGWPSLNRCKGPANGQIRDRHLDRHHFAAPY